MSASLPPQPPPAAHHFLSQVQDEIAVALEQACDFGSGCPDRLADAIRYSLLAPGKRLRPALVLWGAEACGGTSVTAMPAAIAVEMIHAYSLVHDDLPAMDDDDLRRGRPTTHIAFDEATAILVGDALQAKAFEILATRLPPEIAARACAELARAAGPAALVGGQADDLAAESGESRTIELLESIHRRKTAALLIASLRLGGLCANATESELGWLEAYGICFGLAFQIVDDLLDATATAEETGKRTGQDQVRGKLTYPAFLGLEASRIRARELLGEAKRLSGLFGNRGQRLNWMAEYVSDRGRLTHA